VPDHRFSTFLREALDTIALGSPGHHRRLVVLMRPLRLRLHIDGEDLLVSSDGDNIHLGDSDDEEATVVLESSRGAILALLDAERTLEESVLEESIVLRGEVDTLLLFHDGLLIFLNGAARCPSMSRLLQQYRGG
jgi:hypothetical protein